MSQKSSWGFLLGLFFLLFVMAWRSAITAQAGPLFVGVMPLADEQSPTTPTIRHRYVHINLPQLERLARQGQTELLLELFADEVVTVVPRRVDVQANGRFVWVGHVPDIPYSDVTLAINDGVMMGTINLYDRSYRLRYVADGIHRIEQLPLNQRPGMEPLVPEPLPNAAPATHAMHTAQPLDEDGSVIDVLVLYTPAVRAAAGGTAAAQALVDLAVAETNTGYGNSQVNFQLRLAHAAEVTYNEIGDFTTDLTRLQDPADGHMDSVHTLRNAYEADVVALLIAGHTYCGLAYVMTSPSTAFAPYAFSVTDYSCATGYYSFGHEIGHNMGSTHDSANATLALYPYSYGYQDPARNFRTIMAYNCVGGCPRINHWSNPHIPYAGLPTGLHNSADNARSLNEAAVIVANFRTNEIEPTPTPTLTPIPTSTATPIPTATPTPIPTPPPVIEWTLTNQGGVLQTADTTLTFPPNMFANEVIIMYEALAPYELPALPPEGLGTTAYQYRLTATEVSTGLPAQPLPGQSYTVRLDYHRPALNLVKEPTIGWYWWDETAAQWVLEATSQVDTDLDQLHAEPHQLGVWAVLGAQPERLFIPLIHRR